MTVVLQLVTGGTPDNPPRVPTSTLDLAELSGGRIFLPWDGPSPGGAGKRELLTAGKGWGRDGERRIGSRRGNAEFSLLMNLKGGGYADLENARQQIVSYLERAGLWEERRIGEPVWLEHRWTPAALVSKKSPQVGQWSRFWRVLDGSIPEWSKKAHIGGLMGGGFVLPEVAVDLVCAPVAMGHRELAYNTAGLPGVDSDISLSKAVALSTTTGNWCLAGWFKHVAASYCVFEVYYTADFYFNARYNAANTRWEVRYKAGGSEVLVYSGAYTYTAGSWLHVAMSTNGNLYINGVLTTTMGVYGWSQGTLYLGDRLSGADTGYAGHVDGWRLWEENWTQSEIQALYADELPVKAAGLDIGRPLFNKTRSGGGSIDNCDGTINGNQKDNWCVVGHVPGDMETSPRIIVNPPSAGPTTSGWGYYLGIDKFLSPITPSSQHWVDYSGTTDTGSSSGDSYKQDNSIGGSSDWIVFFDVNTQANAEKLRDRYTVLMRFRSVSGAITLRPFIQFYDGNTRVLFAEKTVASGSTMNLVEVGDIVIPEYESLPRIVWGAYIAPPGFTYSVYTDFLVLMKDAVKLRLTTSDSITSATSDKLVVENGKAELQKSTSQKYRDIFYTGPVLHVAPGHYNYLSVLFGVDGDQHYPQLGSGGITIYVTPRWSSSGGPVAG